jgi:F0F1-type ATP synthase alpha subunit
VGHEVAILFAIREGVLDAIAVEQVLAFREALRSRLDETEADLLDQIERDDDLGEDATNRLRRVLNSARRALPQGDGP